MRRSAEVGRAIATIFPTYSYARPQPFAVIGDRSRELEDLYAGYDARYRDGAAAELFEIPNAVLFDRTIYVVDGATWVPLYETHREQEREFKRLAFTPELLANARKPSDPAKRYLYIGTVGSENYAHWLVDDLPRSKALDVLGTGVTVLIDGYFPAIDRARYDSLLALQPSATIGIIDKAACYFFDRLYYVTPPSYHPFLKSPEAVACVASLAEHDSGAPRRLFVRRAGLWRNLANEEAVAQALAPLGFVPVSLENVPFSEQRQLFSNAEAIVGVSGAAMGNTIFAPSGIPVIYLAGERFTDPFYWDLAATKRHGYAVCFGTLEYEHRPTFSPFTFSGARIDELVALVAKVVEP